MMNMTVTEGVQKLGEIAVDSINTKNKQNRKNKSSLWMNLESNIHHITKYGFKTTMIRIDGESAVNTLSFESKLAALGIILDKTGAGEAVAVVERKIRVIKERVGPFFTD